MTLIEWIEAWIAHDMKALFPQCQSSSVAFFEIGQLEKFRDLGDSNKWLYGLSEHGSLDKVDSK